MTNLVLLRELIRNEHSSGHSDNINNTFAWIGFDSLFEGLIARGSLPHSPIAIALCFSVMGVKTIPARARLGSDLPSLRKWYTKSASNVITFEITPTRYPAFTAALERVHTIAIRTSPMLDGNNNSSAIDMVARPTSFILRDRLQRDNLANAAKHSRRKRHRSTHKPRSPRSMVTLSGTSYASSQPKLDLSQPSEFDHEPTIRAELDTQVIPDTANGDENSDFAREMGPPPLALRAEWYVWREH